MDPGRPSQTAEGVALLRALHRVVDAAPPVLDDPVAAHVLPPAQRRFVERLPRLANPFIARFQRRTALARMRAQVVVRQRAIEDWLAAAVDEGAGTYIVLGAGLDTFALRRPAGLAVDVVEVDHPDSQRWKRELVTRHLTRQAPPPGCTAAEPLWCAVDFEQQALGDVLADTLPALAAPVFVAWLGVTYYLTEEAIRATLGDLARVLPPGSGLGLDYWSDPQAPEDFIDAPLLWATRLGVALQREPMRFFAGPERMAAIARGCGWEVDTALSADAQQQRWLAGRGDGLEVPAFAHLLRLSLPG